MRGSVARRIAAFVVVALALGACGDESPPEGEGGGDLSVEAARLSPVVDNPFIAFADVRRAVYEGEEIDPETGEPWEVRVEATVRDTTTEVGGIEVTVVDVSDFEEGELVEKTQDFYAQHELGDVYYIGENVADYEVGRSSATRDSGSRARTTPKPACSCQPTPRSETSSSRSALRAWPRTVPRS